MMGAKAAINAINETRDDPIIVRQVKYLAASHTARRMLLRWSTPPDTSEALLLPVRRRLSTVGSVALARTS